MLNLSLSCLAADTVFQFSVVLFVAYFELVCSRQAYVTVYSLLKFSKFYLLKFIILYLGYSQLYTPDENKQVRNMQIVSMLSDFSAMQLN